MIMNKIALTALAGIITLGANVGMSADAVELKAISPTIQSIDLSQFGSTGQVDTMEASDMDLIYADIVTGQVIDLEGIEITEAYELTETIEAMEVEMIEIEK